MLHIGPRLGVWFRFHIRPGLSIGLWLAILEVLTGRTARGRQRLRSGPRFRRSCARRRRLRIGPRFHIGLGWCIGLAVAQFFAAWPARGRQGLLRLGRHSGILILTRIVITRCLRKARALFPALLLRRARHDWRTLWFYARLLVTRWLLITRLCAASAILSTCLADEILHRLRSKSLPGDALDGFYARARVGDDSLFAAIEPARFVGEIVDDAGVVNDGRVVHNEVAVPIMEAMLGKVMHVGEDEQRWRKD